MRLTVGMEDSDPRTETVELTFYNCPEELFNKLNYTEHNSGNVTWKSYKVPGFEVTFFKAIK